jgi:hypothetical protein
MLVVIPSSFYGGLRKVIKFESEAVYGWEAAIRGMRNPMNSWDKSDSDWEFVEDPSLINPNDEVKFVAGENDLKLMKSLSKAGSDHGKFLRFINVTVDITAPLYWWKEFDTYKVGTVANSCSTMHKIHSEPFKREQFSHEHLDNEDVFTVPCANGGSDDFYEDEYEAEIVLDLIIIALNHYRKLYLKTKDKKYWWQMIQLLPTSYNQKRTVQLNYQVLKSMYFARKSHKLDEWREFCAWCESLPHFKEICINV